MRQIINPGLRCGQVSAPPSKSIAHRMLICAALSEEKCEIKCNGISKDIAATMSCLKALGAAFSEGKDNLLTVAPIEIGISELAHMDCGESGSTLRFLLPITAALGRRTVFYLEGRLAHRPLDDLSSQLQQHGAIITRQDSVILCRGRLTNGTYTLPGNVSSQYISGLLFALPLLKGDSRLNITGKTESSAYITMTEQALKMSGIIFEKDADGYRIPGNQHYKLPKVSSVEGDWSNAAFFLCMGALTPKGITVSGLNLDSNQGDKQILQILRDFGAEVALQENSVFVRNQETRPLTISAEEIPDLVPVLGALLAGAEGRSVITNAQRLRLKESDRLESTAAMINSLGGSAKETDDGIVITGRGSLFGGIVDSYNDHRIAMAAAVAACLCNNKVTVSNAECTDKSYPTFWNIFNRLRVN